MSSRLSSVMSHNDLTVNSTRDPESRVWDVRKMQKVPVRTSFIFSVPCGTRTYSYTREQTPRSGVLELELEDVEKLDKTKDSTTTLRAAFKHDKSVTSAYWDPRGRSIVSTSYDDVLRSTSPFVE